MFEKGKEITLFYPKDTHVRWISKAPRKERNLIVHKIRDLVTEPLTPMEFLKRPYTSRSRWLVTGWDVELRMFRQFYPGSTNEFSAPGTLQLALYAPDDVRPRELLSHQFEPSVVDRREMIRIIAKWMNDRQRDQQDGVMHPADAPDLRIIASDLRLIA
jgi:hypothetical protein